jgi:hypothetical protein
MGRWYTFAKMDLPCAEVKAVSIFCNSRLVVRFLRFNSGIVDPSTNSVDDDEEENYQHVLQVYAHLEKLLVVFFKEKQIYHIYIQQLFYIYTHEMHHRFHIFWY